MWRELGISGTQLVTCVGSPGAVCGAAGALAVLYLPPVTATVAHNTLVVDSNTVEACAAAGSVRALPGGLQRGSRRRRAHAQAPALAHNTPLSAVTSLPTGVRLGSVRRCDCCLVPIP